MRDADYPQNFARSLSLEDAEKSNLLLGYELNGKPLPKAHGGPVSLIVPGWYGVAWVKWINRVEIHDRKYLNRFMAVTIRGEKRGEETIWRETSVGRMHLKSVAARVTRVADRPLRALWAQAGAMARPSRWSKGRWKPAQLTPNKDPYACTFWSAEWAEVKPGEHIIASRATDIHGNVQPTPDDPRISMKKTRWENNQQAVCKIKIEA